MTMLAPNLGDQGRHLPGGGDWHQHHDVLRCLLVQLRRTVHSDTVGMVQYLPKVCGLYSAVQC